MYPASLVDKLLVARHQHRVAAGPEDPPHFSRVRFEGRTVLCKQRHTCARFVQIAEHNAHYTDLPRLLDETAAVRCVQNRIEPEAAAVGDLAVECVTEIWFGDSEERREAMGSFQPEAGSLMLLAVSEFESVCGG